MADDSGNIPVTSIDGSCRCCGADDAAGRGACEDSSDAPVNGGDGSCDTSKSCGAFDCWARALKAPPLAGDGVPAIVAPPLPVIHSPMKGVLR